MPRCVAKCQSALIRLHRMSMVDGAAGFVAFVCVLPLLLGIILTLMGRPSWRVASAGPALAGFRSKAAPAAFNWWNRSFQSTASAALDESLPLRNWMVRVNNELDYLVLRHSRMAGGSIVIGKGGVLFERAYILHAFGYLPSISDKTIRGVGERLKRLHRLLARRGIPMIVLGTPGKVSLMRESVPAAFPVFRPGAASNYDRLLKIFADLSVPFFDGRAELLEAQIAGRGPLFPRGGTHWTLLGAYAALERPMAGVLRESDPSGTTRIVLDDVAISPRARGVDADLLDLMNLLAPDRSYGSLQLNMHLEGAQLPKAIVIVGSSFAGQIQSLLTQVGLAPRVMNFQYMMYLVSGATDAVIEALPATWPQIILNETSIVIVELNEGAFFGSNDGQRYLDTLAGGLIPLLEEPEYPASVH